LLGVKKCVSSACLLKECCQVPLQFYWLRSAVRLWNTHEQAESALLRAAVLADADLSAVSADCWSAQLLAALHSHGIVQDVDHQRSAMLSGLPFDLAAVVKGWQQSFDAACWPVAVDPCAPEVPNRKAVTYRAWFGTDAPTKWANLQWYLRAGVELSPPLVRNMARLRLSSHNFAVETGRYGRGAGHVAYLARVCPRCAACPVCCHGAPVETEHHVLLDCCSFARFRNFDFRMLFHPSVTTCVQDFMEQPPPLLIAQYVHACVSAVDAWVRSGFHPSPDDPCDADHWFSCAEQPLAEGHLV
jgi:hypothetical protein